MAADLQAAIDAPIAEEIDGVAAGEGRDSITALAWQLQYGTSESAKIDAAIKILDRGYGRPTVEAGADPMLPFLGRAPVRVTANDVRDEARNYGRLAVLVLKKLRDNAKSETVRVRAAGALLDRGLGTVTPARVPASLNGGSPQGVGKKEQQATTARAAAVGRYAPPPAPRTMQ